MFKFESPASAILATLAIILPMLTVGCADTAVQESAPGESQGEANSISARHILVQYQGSLKASPDITRTKEEALARIQECLEKANQGEKFEDLAIEYSDGPSAPQGGDLGSFTTGMMVPPFEEAAFACKVGEITDVVETPFGYHIIQRYE